MSMQTDFGDNYQREEADDDEGVQQVESIGRVGIVPTQNNTVITCQVSRRLYEERLVNVNPEYPLTDASKLNVKKGHVVCTGPPVDHGNVAMPIGPNCFAACDGMNSTDFVRALGVIRKGYDQGSNKDNAVSVAISGTQTIENSGIDNIKAGDIIIADWPEIIEQDGRRVPRVNLQGGNNAFYWAVRPFKHGEVFQQFTEVAREVCRVLCEKGFAELNAEEDDMKRPRGQPSAYAAPAAPVTVPAYSNVGCTLINPTEERVAMMVQLIRPIADQFSPIKWANDGRDSPVGRYANYLLYMMGARKHKSWMRGKDEDTRRVIDTTINGGLVVRRLRGDAVRSRRVSQYGSRNPMQNAAFVNSFPLMMQTEQTNLYRRMFLGTALRNAAPGEAFDINLGFGNI